MLYPTVAQKLVDAQETAAGSNVNGGPGTIGFGSDQPASAGVAPSASSVALSASDRAPSVKRLRTSFPFVSISQPWCELLPRPANRGQAQMPAAQPSLRASDPPSSAPPLTKTA